MANILTAIEAATVLRCEASDAGMLQLLPMVDAYIKQATGRDWTLDSSIEALAKSAARILLVQWHENPGMLGGGQAALSAGLSACLAQLEARAIELASSGVPSEALEIVASQPKNGDDDVAITANVVIVFNHEMAAAATSAAVLKNAAGSTVTTVNSLDVTGKILTINPAASLTVDAMYTLSLTDAADVYGQTLTEDIVFWTA